MSEEFRVFQLRPGDLFRALYQECALQKTSFFLWFPVFVSFGVGLYFSLLTEPPLILALLGFLFASAFLVVSDEKFKAPTVIVFLIATGFMCAQIRTEIVYTPILQKDIGPVSIEGTVDEIEDLGDGAGARLVLSALNIEKLEPSKTPDKVRLKIWKDDGLIVGQRVRVLAKIRKPSAPVIPGGFDFQRYLYFKNIGAVGFTLSNAEILEDVPAWGFSKMIERARQKISQSLEAHIPYPQAPVAMALMNGRKTAIKEEDSEAMRHSGLAHMLAISGLHMGLFTGVVFFFVRLFLALAPGLALKYPIKKYTAVAAVIAGFAYMFLAGATIPTQRALLMTGIVFMAIIIDRSPLSLRLVAFAALVVLLLFPESLLSASFHMSFAAVAGLILFYEWLRPYWSVWHRQAGIFRRVALYFFGVCMTTVIATLATAPFALFHFQELATYSLLGNIVAMPILAFVVMPSVVAAMLLMPFGLEVIAYYPLDAGVRGILATAHFVEGLPHAVIRAPMWPLPALIGLVLGLLILFLWRGRLRFLGLSGLAVAAFMIMTNALPDILISPTYELVAYKDDAGRLHISNTRREKFISESWARLYGLEPEELLSWPREGGDGPLTCGEGGCRLNLKGYKVAYSSGPAGLSEDCAEADIVLSREPAGECAAPMMIDFFDVYRGGAHAIWLKPEGPVIKATETLRGARPWSSLNQE